MAMDGIRINPHLGLLEALEAAQLMDRRLTVTANNLAKCGYTRVIKLIA
jgi:hypothetical protein